MCFALSLVLSLVSLGFVFVFSCMQSVISFVRYVAMTFCLSFVTVRYFFL